MSDADRLVAELRPYVADEHVLAAIRRVPREAFVPGELRDQAYENVALAIGCGQTISQPLVVARMTELLAVGPDDHVLDVGTGSGYHAAVLARLAARVVSIERHAALSESARAALDAAGARGVTLIVGDGSWGYPEAAPYDAINVAARGPRGVAIRLAEQLADGGRLVIPSGGAERLVLIRRRGARLEQERHDRVRFVPLVTGPGAG